MPTETVFGPGCLERLGEQCRGLGAKALLVTGKRSARTNGALDKALAQLPGATLFEGVEENPCTETCDRGAKVCRDKGCDFVVAIGGGSPMDAAKAIAVLALNPGPCSVYFGVDKFESGNLPVVAVPTTAGTGSEVTPYAVITDTANREKRTIVGRRLFPVCAIMDPLLSLTMPEAVTANTGLDALSQAMEGMVARNSTPLGDVLAIETCRLVRQWLPLAVANGQDLEARAHMLYAAMLSGCVIAQSKTTLVHGMGYYLTLEFGLAHGLANALLLTPVFQYNALHQPEKVAAMAAALGYPAEPRSGDVGARVAEAIHALLRDVGVSPAGRHAGVDGSRLRWCAERVCADRSRLKNQVGEPSVDEVAGFYEQAYDGAVA